MTVTSDFMSSTDSSAFNHARASFERPVPIKDAGHLFTRALRRFGGAAMILSAFGLWLMPGSDLSADVLLIKLVVSLIAGVGGAILMASK